ncbi:MAG: hypothetical protein K2W99_01130 [Chthoniobacterales bacterium]|nr:hypothetical protein [Chthoniobacterales bacterium]
MKPLLAFLFLLLMATSFFQAHATVICDPKTDKCHTINNTIIPNKKFQKDFDQKAKQPIDQTFYGDQNSDETTIEVTLHQKIQVVLTLPNDEEKGELTHEYDLIGSVSAESPLENFPCNETIEQKDNPFPLSFEKFYLTGGLHLPGLQQGVTMSFCVVVNKVNEPGKPYALNFRLWDCRFTRDLYPAQYRRTGVPKIITWNVKVTDPATPENLSRVQ